jgi:hypothetical protein
MANLAFRSASTTTAGSSSGSSLAINKGAGAAAGDIQVYVVSWWPNTSVVTPPTGFALLKSVANSGNMILHIFAKRLDGSEGASFTFNSTGSVWRTAVGALYQSGTYTGTQPDVSSSGQADSTASASQTAPSVTTLGPNRMLVWGHATENSNSNSSSSGAASNFRAHLAEADIADALFAAAGATGTTAPGGAGTDSYASIHVALISDPDATTKAPPPPTRPQRVIYRTRRF